MALASNMGFEWSSDAAFDALDCNTLASGDVDVVNTTIQLIRPCLDDVTVLASITPERLDLAPDAPTVSELDADLSLTLWNGLFVHKDTPQDVRDKIAEVASKTVMSDRAQQFATDTGAQVYWMNAEEAAAQLERDAQAFATVDAILGE